MVLELRSIRRRTIPTSRSSLRKARASLKRPATVAHGMPRAPGGQWSLHTSSVSAARISDQRRGQRLGLRNGLGRGGGGISPDHFAIPSWQKLKGVITKANEGSTKYRNGPDVSANSNFTFYVCADQRACTSNNYGGTSFAAPMWAGYLALTNQQAAAHKDKAPGFINPTIYPLGLGKGYATAFHDITVGSNGFPGYQRLRFGHWLGQS